MIFESFLSLDKEDIDQFNGFLKEFENKKLKSPRKRIIEYLKEKYIAKTLDATRNPC